MRILFLTQIIPFPPDAGPKVKTWHVLRYLAEQGHDVILASFVRPEEAQYIPELEKICDQVFTIPIHRSRFADMGYWLRSIFTGRPFLIERDDLKDMRSLVNRIIVSEQIDVIHADQITMTQFAIPPKNREAQSWPITIFDAHNAVWKIIERTKDGSHFLLKPLLNLEANRIRHYEGATVCSFDHTLTVSEIDAHALLDAIPEVPNYEETCSKVMTIIPIAVDTNQLQSATRKANSKNILTMGTLHYPPNADGIRWFANEIFPIVLEKMPGTTLTIVGKNPPLDFIKLAEDNPDTIKVTGYVTDLNPFFEDAAMLVVPVRIGGGIRVRILEAFARGTPVVTTTIGLEGIEAQPGIDVLVEDEEISFANAVINLINDKDLQKQLAVNGRNLAVSRYDWQTILKQLNRIYN